MPRKDGLPTNIEQQVELLNTGVEIFGHVLGDLQSYPKWLEGKPVGALVFQVLGLRSSSGNPLSPNVDDEDKIITEGLYISALDPSIPEAAMTGLRDNYMRDSSLTSEQLATYIRSALSLQRKIIGQDATAKSVSTLNTYVSYSREEGNRNLHTDTTMPRSRKDVLDLANVFGIDALAYTRAGLIEKGGALGFSSSVTALQHIVLEGALGTRPLLWHRSVYKIGDPHMPLNGLEPKGFLQEVAKNASGQIQRLNRQIENFEAVRSVYSQKLLEDSRARRAAFQKQLRQASNYMD